MTYVAWINGLVRYFTLKALF